MFPSRMDRVLDIACGIAIGWLFVTRKRRHSRIPEPIATDRMSVAGDVAAAPSAPEATDVSDDGPDPVDGQQVGVASRADAMASLGDSWDTRLPSPQRAGGTRLAPPPPPESETPAHRVLRLGDAPESPIHSQDPADWEDVTMPSGHVWAVPRGLVAMGDRASAACHVRKTFRRVKWARYENVWMRAPSSATLEGPIREEDAALPLKCFT